MTYESMTKEDRHNLLRQAEQSADQLKNGDVRPQIDEYHKGHPNSYTDDEYDYVAAARAGALPDGSDPENATLSPDYFKEGFTSTSVYNTATGQYDYEPPTEESAINSWFYKADKAMLTPEGADPALYPEEDPYMLLRTTWRAGQVAAQGLVDQFFNESRLLANSRETDLIFANIEALDRNKAMLDPEYYAEETARLKAKIDPEAMAEAWDNRPQIQIIRPIDMKDEIISEIGSFFIPYAGASKALKPLQAALKVNPAKLGKYLNGTVAGIKELIAGAFADRNLAYGADLHANFATIMRQALDAAYTDDSGFASVGEFLAEIGIESDDLKGMDAAEADSDLERANLFAIEGAMLGVLFPAVLKGMFGSVKLGGKFWKYAKEGGFSEMSAGSPKSMEGKIQFKTRVKRYTTREEQALLNPKMEKKVEDLLEYSASPQEVAAMAAAGGAKRGWYRASMQAIRHVFGQDAEKFTALLSATSPQTQVESNLRNSLNVWKNWTAAGRPRDEASIMRIMGASVEGTKGEKSVLDAWKNNSLEVLMRDDTTLLSGPKVNSFWKNLMGFFDEVTQDTHMARGEGLVQPKDFAGAKRVATGKKGIKGGGYIAGNMLIREAADIMTKATGDVWTPAEIQETVWSWVKTIWDAEKGDARNIPQLLKEGAITDEMIRDTPDFATMFSQQGEFRQILEDAGYGQKLNDLPDTGYGQAGAVSSGTGQSRHLKSSAERLDRTKRVTGTDEPKFQNVEQIKQLWDRTFRPSGSGKGGVSETLSPVFRRDARPTGGRVLNQYSLPEDVSKKFNALGVSTPTINEVTDPATFIESINKAKATNLHGSAVHVYTPEEYADMRLFLTEDGTAGAALKSDGDMVSLFNTGGGPNKRISRYLFALQVELGGTKLDAFDINGYLPTLYKEMGFKITKRNKFVKKYAPEGWDYDLLGKPDVIYMEKVK